MCRLFGFRSVLQSQVHQSLIHAENALLRQSEEHPDGWGVAFYQANAPHILRSTESAINDSLFKRVSGIVSSKTVLAHLRKATVGNNSILNTHPFQFGRWVFAHNGNIKNFEELRPLLLERVEENLRPFILGETDSELLFFLVLSELQKEVDLADITVRLEQVREAVRSSVEIIKKETGLHCPIRATSDKEGFSLSFLLTDGLNMLSHRWGKEIYFSTHKNRCSDRESCPHLAKACETPIQELESQKLTHLLISSEALVGENIWNEMQQEEIIAVDAQMNCHRYLD